MKNPVLGRRPTLLQAAVGLSILCVAILLRCSFTKDAPDPFAQCERKQSAVERQQCIDAVNLAISSGN